MPVIRNETKTILLIPKGAEEGATLKLAPKGKDGDRIEVAKVSETLYKAEGNKLVKIFSSKRSAGGREKEPPKPQPDSKNDSQNTEQPKTGE
jgi:hypothetical protein